MALTENRLRQIVREEARRVMREGPYSNRRDWGTMYDTGPGARAREEAWEEDDMRQRGGRGYDERHDEDEPGSGPGRKPNLNPDRWWDAEHEDELEDDGW